jgi:putative inorganic carbon (hco3(-)) transporter
MAIDWMAYAVTAAFLAPAIVLAARGSSLLVDYAIFLYVINREIRRVVDWAQGSFNPFSPIVLIPLIATCLLVLPFFSRFGSLHPTTKKIFILFFLAVGYGTFVGLACNGIATVYAASEFLSPIALIGFTATAPVDERTADRWMKSAGWITVGACLYGWFQYLTVPPWDAYWVQQVGFVGYLGKPAPTEMTVFSTFAERGPCASFLSLALIPIVVARRWRLFLGWPEALLILSTIVLTLVRTGLILIGVSIFIHPLLNRGRAALGIVALVVVIGVAGFLGLNRMPNADRINGRLSTFGNIEEDGSFLGRVEIADAGIKLLISNPVGYGIGSSGLGGRLNTGSASDSEALIGDNGYLEVLTGLGLPGGLLFVVGFVLVWSHLSTYSRFGLVDDYVGLSRTFFVVLLIGMLAGNYFSGLSVMWVALGQALSPRMLAKLMVIDELDLEIPATIRS